MGYPEAQYVIEELSREFEEVAPQFGPEPKPVVVTNVVNNKKNAIDLTVTMPGDTVIDGYTLVKLAGVKVVYKKDSIPENPEDGTLFKDITSPLTGSTHVTITGLENLASYGIRFFPYSDKGTYSTDPSNGAMYTVEYENYVAFTQNFNDSNIDTCISYLGQNKDWSPVRVDSSQNVKLNQWADWDWLKKIKYAIIDKNGHIVEDLNINDWTKKTDGSPSMLSQYNGNLAAPFRNMDNSSNTGDNIGLYVWFPNLYMKEVYSGSQRTVYFSTTKDGKTMADANLVIGHVYDQDYKGLWVPMFPNTSRYNNMSKYPCSYRSSLSSRYNIGLNDSTIRSAVTNIENITKSVMSNWVFNGAPFALVLRDILIMLSKSSCAARTNGQMIRSSYGNVRECELFYKGGIFPSISNSDHSYIAAAPFGLFSMFLHGNEDGSNNLLIDLYQYFTLSKDHLYRTVLQKNIASILTDKSEPVVSTRFGSVPSTGGNLKYCKKTRLVKSGCASPIDPEVWEEEANYKYFGGYVHAGNGFLYMATTTNSGMVEHDFWSELNIDSQYYSHTYVGIGGGIIVLPAEPDYDPNEV